MYASLNSHEDKDQGYRDDLWSILFSFIDILLGQLPWSEEGKKKEKQLVKELKRKFTSDPSDEIFTKWILNQLVTAEKQVRRKGLGGRAVLSVCLFVSLQFASVPLRELQLYQLNQQQNQHREKLLKI